MRIEESGTDNANFGKFAKHFIVQFWIDSLLIIVTLIAYKSDPAELPKSWFSVNNITENSRTVLLF